jgi:hypothetical protein
MPPVKMTKTTKDSAVLSALLFAAARDPPGGAFCLPSVRASGSGPGSPRKPVCSHSRSSGPHSWPQGYTQRKALHCPNLRGRRCISRGRSTTRSTSTIGRQTSSRPTSGRKGGPACALHRSTQSDPGSRSRVHVDRHPIPWLPALDQGRGLFQSRDHPKRGAFGSPWSWRFVQWREPERRQPSGQALPGAPVFAANHLVERRIPDG